MTVWSVSAKKKPSEVYKQNRTLTMNTSSVKFPVVKIPIFSYCTSILCPFITVSSLFIYFIYLLSILTYHNPSIFQLADKQTTKSPKILRNFLIFLKFLKIFLSIITTLFCYPAMSRNAGKNGKQCRPCSDCSLRAV